MNDFTWTTFPSPNLRYTSVYTQHYPCPNLWCITVYTQHYTYNLAVFDRDNKGITTPRIYQYWIFHHTTLETCFEMLNPQNTRNYDSIQTINPPIFKIFLNLICWSPNFILLLHSKNRGPKVFDRLTWRVDYSTKGAYS